MAGAICLEGKTLWLDVGLHCKGRVSPPGEGRFEVGTPTWPFFFFIIIYKSYTCLLQVNQYRKSSLLPSNPHPASKQW